MISEIQTPHTDDLVKSGYAGILMPSGRIVDRREHPEATPLKESAELGVPAPKDIYEEPPV
jgi:hypothetical protein